MHVVCPAPTLTASVNTVAITFHVYFSRLLFYLIACESLALVMDHLTPPTPTTLPITTLPLYPATFRCSAQRAQHSLDHTFTLPGLLQSQEHLGYYK
jgi:hypothetical protein